ncbi:MAG TPA: 5-oxoprolinase subunit PxpA [Devosia sp.]|nr:5-oxoprolinase subunit PxpA [Devosia sp.]
MTSLDLNADLGEGMPNDAALLGIVSSASIACGGHAGTEETMRAALRGAKAAGVVAGAHPGFADPANFGRKRLELTSEELTRQMREQLETLAALARDEGVPLRYVKLHGALANMAAEDELVASIAFAAVRNHNPGLAILAIDNSAQVAAAEALGLRVIREAYADRAYQPDGLLVPRSAEGAVIHDPAAIVERAIRLAERRELVAIDGSVIPTAATSLCIHGDNDGAVSIAEALKAGLAAAGIAIAATNPAEAAP